MTAEVDQIRVAIVGKDGSAQRNQIFYFSTSLEFAHFISMLYVQALECEKPERAECFFGGYHGWARREGEGVLIVVDKSPEES